MRSSSIALILLAGTALAVPTHFQAPFTPTISQDTVYSVVASRSGSPLHGLPLNAIFGRFYLGGVPSTYCPRNAIDGKVCPTGNTTVFRDSCTLDSENPRYFDIAEQTIWSTASGVIGYNTDEVPPRDTFCPWYLSKSKDPAFVASIQPVYGADGFLACSTEEVGIWQVLRHSSDRSLIHQYENNSGDCLSIDLMAVSYDDPTYAAWIYL